MESTTPVVPAQEVGVQKDTAHTVQATTPEAAQALFQLARKRLLDVNNWHVLCAGLSSTFTLRDAKGLPVGRPARVGDFFQIDIPGPGTDSGEGYDWVQVEVVEDRKEADGELTFLRVRPAPSPLNEKPDVAHFLDNQATSTFLVSRQGLAVSAEVHGRNEVSNTSADSVIDKVRNAVAAVGAWMGFSDLQWKQLVEALVCEAKPQRG